MTRDVIMQFMWGYQEHFRFALERLSTDCLGTLSPDLQPRALLVGLRTPDSQSRHAVCIEPENGPVSQELFDRIEDRVRELLVSHRLKNVLYGDEPSNRDKPRRMRAESVTVAVRERLGVFDKEALTTSFCGRPALVNGFEVVPVVQVKAEALEALPRLKRTRAFLPGLEIIPSLAHAVIDRLLLVAHRGLCAPDPGRASDGDAWLDGHEVLRRAAKDFSYSPTSAGRKIEALGELFDLCCDLASQRYESRPTRAHVLIAAADHPSVEWHLRFSRPVRLRETRWARKLIEMASGDLSLLCDGLALLGIGRLKSDYDSAREDAFVLAFSGHGRWDLLHDGAILMRVEHRIPTLPRPRLSKDLFVANLRRVVRTCDDGGAQRIWSVVSAAINQGHGTMVVVSAAAGAEASRLGAQATRIDQTPISTELVASVSQIDGAILLDPSGNCHAVGVILDGRASSGGSPSRGARFNSAIRYVEAAEPGTLAVVVSEDGDVDLVPLLRPQVDRKELLARLADVDQMLQNPDLDRIHDLLRWLDTHRFYLSAEHCEKVNIAARRFEGLFMKEGRIWIVRQPHFPDPAMDESYFLPTSSAETQ